MSLTVGSLFAGIGGLELGLERAGMRVAWQVEIDEYCRKVLAKHWPDVPRFEDVRTVGAHNLPRVDVICGGFPCQPVSHNGHQRVEDDERWLWPEFARLVGELRPQFALLENVPGLLVRGMGAVLGDLAALRYDAEWETIPASFVGSPQKRDRVFVVAYPHGIGCQAGSRVLTRDPAGAWRGLPRRGFSGRVLRVPDPGVHWMVDGVPPELDGLRTLGNAVVPQVAEYIGRCIMAAAETTESEAA